MSTQSIHEKIAAMAGGTYGPAPEDSRYRSDAISWDDGSRVHLQMKELDDRLELGMIAAVPEGEGNGAHVIKVIKRYAERVGLPVKVVEMDNPDFFDSQGFTPDPDWDDEVEYPDYWWHP